MRIPKDRRAPGEQGYEPLLGSPVQSVSRLGTNRQWRAPREQGDERSLGFPVQSDSGLESHRLGRPRCSVNAVLVPVVLLIGLTGCGSLPTWILPQACVLDPGASKEDLVSYLNQNVLGTESRSGLVSWRTGNAKLHVTDIPFGLPASIAVEAPRNLRFVVSNPMSGGHEVDIGSNSERFWIWTKDSPQIITARHADVPLALQQLNMPIHIHPDWLMEVFGVIPIDGGEYQLVRPSPEARDVELIAVRTSPLGRPVERVIRVNVCRGHITEHILRHPDGHVIARALLDRYTTLPNGNTLPMAVKLQWPDAHVEMTMQLGTPEANPPSLSQDSTIWEIPVIHGARAVDVGAMARHAAAPAAILPAKHQNAAAGGSPGAGSREHEAGSREDLHSSLLAPPRGAAAGGLPGANAPASFGDGSDSSEQSPRGADEQTPAGRVSLSPSVELEAPEPTVKRPRPASFQSDAGAHVPDADAHEWARPFTATGGGSL